MLFYIFVERQIDHVFFITIAYALCGGIALLAQLNLHVPKPNKGFNLRGARFHMLDIFTFL